MKIVRKTKLIPSKTAFPHIKVSHQTYTRDTFSETNCKMYNDFFHISSFSIIIYLMYTIMLESAASAMYTRYSEISVKRGTLDDKNT